MRTTQLRVETTGAITDITALVRQFCAQAEDGLVNVFAPHSTVGLALAQVGDGSGADIVSTFRRLPRERLTTNIERRRPGMVPTTWSRCWPARRS